VLVVRQGTDPRTAPGVGVGIAWPEGEDRPAPEEIERALADPRLNARRAMPDDVLDIDD
jgi:hypothetical protein